MNKTVITLTLLLLGVSLFLPTRSFGMSISGSSAVLQYEAKVKDERPEKIRKFLNYYDSPFLPYSDLIVSVADKYNIDWRLLTAISGVESTFGRNIPKGTFNAYGWNNGDYSFKSWEDSIDHVSSVLSEKYIKKGLDTPFKIAPIYCPPSNTWARKVAYFMKKIEDFSKNDPLTLELNL